MNKNYILANQLKNVLTLKREPVGITFIKEIQAEEMTGFDTESKNRYCQALMRAGQGEQIIISSNNISCPASAAA